MAIHRTTKQVDTILTELLRRPIAFHPIFRDLTGTVAAGLMLSQAYYWSDKTGEGGWFYKTADQWTEETSLSRKEQTNARKRLKQLDFWEEKLEKANGAPTLHYNLNIPLLHMAIMTKGEIDHRDHSNVTDGKDTTLFWI